MLLPLLTPSGSYAEYATVPEDWLAYIPDNLPSNIAGGVPLVGLTAWQAIMDAKPQPGQRVLILAGKHQQVGMMGTTHNVRMWPHTARTHGMPGALEVTAHESTALYVMVTKGYDVTDACTTCLPAAFSRTQVLVEWVT